MFYIFVIKMFVDTGLQNTYSCIDFIICNSLNIIPKATEFYNTQGKYRI